MINTKVSKLIISAAFSLALFVSFGTIKVQASTITTAAAITTIETAPNGIGSKDKPYKISTVGNLAWLSKHTEIVGKYFIMTNDIDAKDWIDETPIGTSFKPFSGTFDGRDYVIKNITINTPNIGGDISDYNDYEIKATGLFGSVLDCTIKNVTLKNVNIVGNYYVGGLVGCQEGSRVINSRVSGTVKGNCFVGGLSGVVLSTDSKKAFVYESSSSVDVTSGIDEPSSYTDGAYVGGLVGLLTYAEVLNSSATGNVSGDHGIGGLIGDVLHGKVTYCHASGKVSANGDVGKLFGSTYESVIENNH